MGNNDQRATSCGDCGGPLLFLENDKGNKYPYFEDQEAKKGPKCAQCAPASFKNEILAAEDKVRKLGEEVQGLLPGHDFTLAINQLIGKKSSMSKEIVVQFGGKPTQYGFARRRLQHLHSQALSTLAGVLNQCSLEILNDLDEASDRRISPMKAEIAELEEQRIEIIRKGSTEITVRGGEPRTIYPGTNFGAARHKLIMAIEIRDKHSTEQDDEARRQHDLDQQELAELLTQQQMLLDLEFEVDQEITDRIGELKELLGDPSEVPAVLSTDADAETQEEKQTKPSAKKAPVDA